MSIFISSDGILAYASVPEGSDPFLSLLLAVFYVIDQAGNKVTDRGLIEQIKQSLGRHASLLPVSNKHTGRQAILNHTVIELTGTDRPGLLSEILAILKECNCNVVEAEVWTHNMRVACVFYVDDEITGAAIEDMERLSSIKQRLRSVMHPNNNVGCSRTDVFISFTQTERRLHQMMFANRDFEEMEKTKIDASSVVKPSIKIHNCDDKGYSMVSVECRDRPKLLFDIVCTLTDMEYIVFHASVESQGSDAYQEHYIRHADGHMIDCEAERQRVIQCLEAAIERRVSEGLRIEMNRSSPVGKLSDATRIFRENGLSVARAELTNNGEKNANVFYVKAATGNCVDSKTVETIRKKIGKTDLQFKESSSSPGSSPEISTSRFSFSDMLKSRPTKFLYNAGFI
eukprot:TRINITY_DN10033_c0_g1_i3.p1 TRINITY_DN10033_c0_g1~~TRINITY_DN10033_c0_g1_i3.p1  ORF type:complete len:400 (+),score=47.18 TRINITY_DN10033_c0_g1_i3:491-1690(+)